MPIFTILSTLLSLDTPHTEYVPHKYEEALSYNLSLLSLPLQLTPSRFRTVCKRIAACCSVLHFVVCCSALQAACCSALQYDAVCCSLRHRVSGQCFPYMYDTVVYRCLYLYLHIYIYISISRLYL